MVLDDPSRWECDAVLADGGTVHVRPTRPTDADDLVAFHGQLSDKTVYLRFFSAMPRFPPALLSRITHPDDDARVSLVAMLGDEIVALAGYDRAAEIAKEAFKTGRTVRELATEMGVLPPDELDEALDARAQTEGGVK